jgi:Zn-dependent peptidase ImmA (M78 family)
MSTLSELNQQADLFAYNFLMPEDKFKEACKEYKNDSWQIAGHFEVHREKVLIWMKYHEIKPTV